MAICRIQLLYASVIMIGSAIFGFNNGYSSPTLLSLDPKENISSSNRSWFQAMHAGGAIFGPFISAFMLNHIGRKPTLFIIAVTSTLFWVGLLFMSLERIWIGIIARAGCGLTIGAFSAVCPMYIVEISPPDATGFYGSLHQFAVALGLVFPYAIGIKFNWKGITYGGLSMSAALSLLVWLIPESPAYKNQLEKKKQEPGQKKNIMLEQLNEDGSLSQSIPEPQKSPTIFQLRYMPKLLPCIMFGVFQQLCGVNAIFSNLSQLFTEAHMPLEPNIASTISSGLKVFTCFLAAPAIQRFGRRFIWVVSACGCAIFDLLFSISTMPWVSFPPFLSIVIITSFLLSFGLGVAPIPWFIVSEMFEDDVRPQAASIVSITIWVFTFIVIWVFPVIKAKWDLWRSFLFFFSSSVGAALFGFFFVKDPPKVTYLTEVTYIADE